MTEKRIQFNNIVKNQLPSYVREEFPLVVEFLSQYYISQEFQSAPVDLIQNIDQYIKLDNISSQSEVVYLKDSIDDFSDVVTIDLSKTPSGTIGFPKSYGLLQIDDEIITYTGITSTSFTGCIRGFSGVTSYKKQNSPDELVFSSTSSAPHTAGAKIINLSSLFLKEFLTKLKYQFAPGFESREFSEQINESLFIKYAKDFYATRGTEKSFQILFSALYGENVKVVKPQDYLIKPSDAQYFVSNDLVVESISGNPENLYKSTLNQDSILGYSKAYAPIAKVEKIQSKNGKNYYKLSFDGGYNKDIRVEGSLYGNFAVHPKTKLINTTVSGSTTLDVDSTIGFPNSGELYVVYNNGVEGTIKYKSKNINQFFDCDPLVYDILDQSEIALNVYAYGTSNNDQNEIIKVRITSILDKVNIDENTYYASDNDTAVIRTLGISSKDPVSKNWFYNIATNYNVKSISLIDSLNSTYSIITNESNSFRVGDNIVITNSFGVEKSTTIISISSSNSFAIKGQGPLSLTDTYTIRRNILKANSLTFPQISKEVANVQNVYKDGNKTLVAASSLPFYNNQPLNASIRSITFSGSFSEGDSTFRITSGSVDHGFYSGDAVYYTPGNSTSPFVEGLYFIKRVDQNNVKFAKSRSDIYNSKFVTLKQSVTISSDNVRPYEFKSKSLKSQKLFREIAPVIDDGETYPIGNESVGILINGVELQSHKSKDVINYGPIEKIDVTAPGSNYDVINPPALIIRDLVGTGATGNCVITGSLQEIKILDPGFDYVEQPSVRITGGNGSGASASVSMSRIKHKTDFNSSASASFVNITNSTIGFSTYHKFRNAEKIIYKTNGQRGVGGLSTDAVYYVSNVNSKTIKLHRTFNEAVSGINTITLSSFGLGDHTIESYDTKLIVGSINVTNSGFGYRNNLVTTDSSGISTSNGHVTIENHGFKSGEIVKYTTTGTVIGGLQNNSSYFLTEVDKDTFKLSQVGIASTQQSFFYDTKQYLNFTSSGSGIHKFNYPEITVEIIGNIGISSVSDDDFKCKVLPVFRGSVESVRLSSNGSNYGSSEILNYRREPDVFLDPGSGAQLSPIVSNGKIVEVLVKSGGKNYYAPPTLQIIGDGIAASLTPVLENGQIKSINIISGGAGYLQSSTTINVISAGDGAKFLPKIKEWTFNSFYKYFATLSSDDGIITEGVNDDYELQYKHIYPSRKFRESIYSLSADGSVLYGSPDLLRVNNTEVSSSNHSPIIGWAYDGNPIYGPYGYSKKDGGTISQLKSGYVTSIKANRPLTSVFPLGFFVEDFDYKSVNDDTVLDQHNGRFCVTPDFPNGVYAYFATFNTSTDTSGIFNGYKAPSFPYVIGKTYKSIPNDFNFKPSSNQDSINLNQTNWIRNTLPYHLGESNSYKYISLPNNLNQTVDVKYASPGVVDRIGIVTGGSNYKVNDSIVFDEANTRGFGLTAKVSKIKGKTVNTVSVASTVIYNCEVYPTDSKGSYVIFSENPHNISDGDLVVFSGINTASSILRGDYTSKILVNTLSFNNATGLGTVGATGIVTYIPVSGNLDYPNIRENDILTVENEKVKVLNIDKKSSRIRILRSIDGTVGASHTFTSSFTENPRKLYINVGYKTSYEFRYNKEIYFDPKETLGIGTVGIGSTLSFSNPGAGASQVFIPLRALYLPNHQLETGDTLTYHTNNNGAIGVSTNGSTSFSLSDQSTLYVAKFSNDLIGISTVKVGLGTTGTFVGIASTTATFGPLYLTGIGTGNYHSFKTNYPGITGQISKNVVTVSTAQTHGLSNNNTVFVDVNPSIATTVVVRYNDYHRKLVVNPTNFLSSDVNIAKNSIIIANHGYSLGQKLIHTATSPSGGLQSNGIYYAVPITKDEIKLSSSYYNATIPNPLFVDITSASNGTLSLVNPPIKVYRDSTLIFDLSHSSLSYVDFSNIYSAFALEFYRDQKFTQRFETTKFARSFEIQNYGRVGITSDAKTVISVNKYFPQKLFYKLTPIFEGTIPSEKTEIDIDSDVNSNNQLEFVYSEYNGEHKITSLSGTSFTYNLRNFPEASSYSSSSSKLEYATNSTTTYGSISEVDILSKGGNYYSLPSVSGVISGLGTGSLLECFSTSIGNIKKTKINDIGFDFPTDFTLKPNLSLVQEVKIEPFASFDYIGITSVGRGYTVAPKLVVLDGKTGRVVPEVDLRYSLGDDKVTILKNSYGINNVPPTIIPTQNSNGVGIGSIKYNSTTQNVTVTLAVGFSTADTFPFKVNDRVYIENISVGVGSTGKGFNSENYNYRFFTLTSVQENRGGIGIVTYSLSGLVNSGEIVGNFDAVNSSGRIIPEKFLPVYNPVLKSNDYLIGESVTSKSGVGIVEEWNPKTLYLSLSSKDKFEPGEIIYGVTSKTQGLASSITSFEGSIDLSAYTKVEKGWEVETGILNNDLQRVQDSLYYQNFSYSLRSKVDYDKWEDVVSTLNHTSGFKKFGDYQCEPSVSEVNANSLKIGVSTSIVDVKADLISTVDLNCVNDFDIVRENVLRQNGKVVSDAITFKNKILTDYFESIGNRVLSIDDFSSEFNSNPRPSRFSEVHRFPLTDARAQKYITYVEDKRYTDEKQVMLVTLLHNNKYGYLNQYGRVETTYDLGSFDLQIDGSDGVFVYYPKKYAINDFNISTLTYNIKDSVAGIGSTSIGNVADIKTSNSFVSSGSTSIIGIGTTYRSVKALVEIADNFGKYQFNEFNILHDGSNIEFLDYGQITTHSFDAYSSSGLGTFYPYISGSELKVDFIPNAGIAATVNTIQVAIASSYSAGITTVFMKHAYLESRSTSIASTTSPTSNVIAEYFNGYDCAYFIVQVSDITNNRHQSSEVLSVTNQVDAYFAEFANVETYAGIGTIGVERTANSTRLTFTPLPSIDVGVNVYTNAIIHVDDDRDLVSFNNATIETNSNFYYGTDRDVKRAFDLEHKNYPIFRRNFDGSSSFTVNLTNNTITLPNHFFVTGEKVTYTPPGVGSTMALQISSTDFGVGIGTTDRLPSTAYIVKVNQNTIKLAKSAEDALKIIPNVLDFTAVGIGTSHSFNSTNQNSRVVVAIDNIIQSPVVSSALTSSLSTRLFTTEDILYLTGISSFFGGDLIKINNEIMRIESIGIGSTNAVRVRRPQLGTVIAGHSTGDLVTKVSGSYNIVDNTINFADAPFGNLPFSSTTNPPDERDWTGISVSSTFQGRSFIRSGEVNGLNHTYYKNYVYDDISEQFNGTRNKFTLKQNNAAAPGVSTENAVILINDVFQEPGLTNNYTLSEATGITSITFVGSATSVPYDVNTSSFPRGGLIVSVGSTEGFGYQPLVSAGGTAIVSSAGTIQSVSIGNSGSGYRAGIYTSGGISQVVVRVGVATSSTGTPNIHFIGTAAVSNGNIVSIAVTNPGFGYTSSNPPQVIIDAPLSYSDIPLIYSSSSVSGLGTEATIDIVVGQGSSVIDFEVKNLGYGYGQGEILTVPVGNIVGIPTLSTFSEFQISIQKTFNDKFNGWSIGELQVFDQIESLFDGERLTFPLKYQGNLVSIVAADGSPINVQDTLLVFVNDILQIPGKGYVFDGGSSIDFTEPPKIDDTCKIIFYRGSGSIDVAERDILETVKIGDELTITYDSALGQTSILQENPRTVTSIESTDFVLTSPYFGPGNTDDSTLERPVSWCRQTEDKIINEKEVGKDRMLYEASIYPSAYLIQPVGIGSTVLYVDNLRPFFNVQTENNTSLSFQNQVTIVSQDSIVAAAATAIVSVSGTITSVSITSPGSGYINAPSVTFKNPVGLGTTQRASGIATISSGIVTGVTITYGGIGYTSTNPPKVLIESPSIISETNLVNSYVGDSGVIVGFGLTTISSIDKVIFDLHVPFDSYLRNSSLVGSAVTLSSLNTGDYFIVYNSNVGVGSTSLVSKDISNSTIGIATQFYDCVYQVDTVTDVQTSIVGVGTTIVRRVHARVSGFSTSTGITTANYFGNFSWGKIDIKYRTENNQFSFYGNNGISGITTSGIVNRTSPLKYNNYIA